MIRKSFVTYVCFRVCDTLKNMACAYLESQFSGTILVHITRYLSNNDNNLCVYTGNLQSSYSAGVFF